MINDKLVHGLNYSIPNTSIGFGHMIVVEHYIIIKDQNSIILQFLLTAFSILHYRRIIMTRVNVDHIKMLIRVS